MQQRGVLRHHADGRPQALLCHRTDILLVDTDDAALEFVEAQEQVHERRLASARSADQAYALARTDREVQVVEHGFAVALAVVEAHVFEADLAARYFEVTRARTIAYGVRD